jgi:hypothetical protein
MANRIYTFLDFVSQWAPVHTHVLEQQELKILFKKNLLKNSLDFHHDSEPQHTELLSFAWSLPTAPVIGYSSCQHLVVCH